jgi:hypothetical protein
MLTYGLDIGTADVETQISLSLLTFFFDHDNNKQQKFNCKIICYNTIVLTDSTLNILLSNYKNCFYFSSLSHSSLPHKYFWWFSVLLKCCSLFFNWQFLAIKSQMKCYHLLEFYVLIKMSLSIFLWELVETSKTLFKSH